MLNSMAKEIRELLNGLEQVGCAQLSPGTELGAPGSYLVKTENGKRKRSTISLRPEEYIALVVLMRGIGAPRRRVSLEDLQAAAESLLEAIKLARVQQGPKRGRRLFCPHSSADQAPPISVSARV